MTGGAGSSSSDDDEAYDDHLQRQGRIAAQVEAAKTIAARERARLSVEKQEHKKARAGTPAKQQVKQNGRLIKQQETMGKEVPLAYMHHGELHKQQQSYHKLDHHSALQKQHSTMGKNGKALAYTHHGELQKQQHSMDYQVQGQGQGEQPTQTMYQQAVYEQRHGAQLQKKQHTMNHQGEAHNIRAEAMYEQRHAGQMTKQQHAMNQ